MIRVVQWTTGNVGRRAVRAVVDHPEMQLVGCYAWSPDKKGTDVGELVGIPPIGVATTNDIEALIALQPDCVVYTPKWPDIDELVRILEAGINVVATAGIIVGPCFGEKAHQRLKDACERGGSSIFGSGMNPGILNLLGLVSAGICDRVECITVSESVDSTGYDSPETDGACGFGRPMDDPNLPAMARKGTYVFEDSVLMMADALGLDLDEVHFEAEFAQTTKDLDLGSWSIKAGCVAGIACSWQGRVNGKTVLDLRTVWRKGQSLQPDWKVGHAYTVEVEGMPAVRTKMQILPGKDFVANSFQEYMLLGMVATALPAVQAIPAVVAAKPGIVTYADLPLVTARGFVNC